MSIWMRRFLLGGICGCGLLLGACKQQESADDEGATAADSSARQEDEVRSALDAAAPTLGRDEPVVIEGGTLLDNELVMSGTPISDTQIETSKIDHLSPLYEAKLTSVNFGKLDIPRGIGYSALRIEAQPGEISGVTNSGRGLFRVEAGKTYKFSARVYSDLPQQQRYQAAIKSEEIGSIDVINDEDGSNAFTSRGGAWTRLEGSFTVPEDRSGEAAFFILLARRGPVTWYLDRVSIQPAE